MVAHFRLVTSQDAEQILAIYTPIVTETVISFELEPPTLAEVRQRITNYSARFPWLICEDTETHQLLGYAYATAYRPRAAYQWSVEVSVYVHEQAQRKGVGQALYTALFKVLALQGYYNAYAGIALPNLASIRLHEALGFEPIGIYHRVGYKLGGWHDVGWWQLMMQEQGKAPDPPKDVLAVRTSSAWEEAMAAGLSRLKI